MSMIKRTLKKIELIYERKLVKILHGRKMHKPEGNTLAINLVSSWDKKCGIATYSAFLAEELRKNSMLFVVSLPDKYALNPYYLVLGRNVARSQDLVHIQFEYGLFPSLKLGRKTLTAFASLLFYLGLSLGNRRVITTIHETRKTEVAGSKGGLFYTRLLDRLIFAVSDIIIIHTLESKEILKKLGVNESKLCVIPHGTFETPKFLDKNECKRKYGLQGKTVLTILGYVTPKKGHDLVIPLLKQLDQNVHLVIAGGPQNDSDVLYLEKLKKLAEQHHCLNRVMFTGYLQDLSPIINATDIALLPYRSVTDSGILHLLVSQLIPTIASDLKAFKEIYQDYGCIELFQSENSQDLLNKMRLLLSDEELRNTLRDKCRDMWNDTKWSTIAKRHLELYREILNSK